MQICGVAHTCPVGLISSWAPPPVGCNGLETLGTPVGYPAVDGAGHKDIIKMWVLHNIYSLWATFQQLERKSRQSRLLLPTAAKGLASRLSFLGLIVEAIACIS
jgi:hypothetical protein